MPVLPELTVTDCRNCSYESSDADPVNVSELVPDVAITPSFPTRRSSDLPDAVTVAEPTWVESISVITTTGDTTTGLPAVPPATGATTTNGGTATGTPNTVTTDDAGTLLFP